MYEWKLSRNGRNFDHKWQQRAGVAAGLAIRSEDTRQGVGWRPLTSGGWTDKHETVWKLLLLVCWAASKT